MKKYIKLILIVVLVVVGIVLVDTIQARIFKNSPIISWSETLADYDSWVDRGILMDTYYCVKEYDIVTVHWLWKNAKFTCPIDNVVEMNEVDGVSMHIKEETLTRTGATIIITDITNKNNIYGQEYRIDKKENSEWKELEDIVEGNYAWTSKAYYVGDDYKLEFEKMRTQSLWL